MKGLVSPDIMCLIQVNITKIYLSSSSGIRSSSSSVSISSSPSGPHGPQLLLFPDLIMCPPPNHDLLPPLLARPALPLNVLRKFAPHPAPVPAPAPDLFPVLNM